MGKTINRLGGTEDCLQMHELRLMRTPLYRSIAESCSELYEAIREALPPELRMALLKYDDLYGDMLIYQEDYFYAEGFKDAIALMNHKGNGS